MYIWNTIQLNTNKNQRGLEAKFTKLKNEREPQHQSRQGLIVFNEPVMQKANTNNDTPVVADMVCVVDI